MKTVNVISGEGREVNPYTEESYSRREVIRFHEFRDSHPPLKAFYRDGLTPLPNGEFDVDLVWQWFDDKFNKSWGSALEEDYVRYKVFSSYQHANDLHQTLTRPIYLSPLPAPKEADPPSVVLSPAINEPLQSDFEAMAIEYCEKNGYCDYGWDYGIAFHAFIDGYNAAKTN